MIREMYPGSGEKRIALAADSWQTITDGMAAVTGPGGTAGMAHLEGIDFAGKTGTAQVMGHDALARTNKGHNTEPNAWFVGMAPRRNPDIVVAALLEHGKWGKYSALLAAQVIEAFVDKQRDADHNLRIAEKVVVVPEASPVPAPVAEKGPEPPAVVPATR